METLWADIKSYFWNLICVPLLPFFRFLPAVATLIGLAFSSGDLIDGFIETLNNLSSYVAGAPSSALVAQVNRITPLAEALAMLASLIGLQATAMTIRFILKFMPGVR